MVSSEVNQKDSGSQKPLRPAATIILVRENYHGLQTYLLKRSSKSKFFPGAYVFPGGVLDEDDRDFQYWKNYIDIDTEKFSERFGCADITDETVLEFCVAGIRETFEEAGALLANNGSIQSLEQACNVRKADWLESGWLRRLTSSGWILNVASLSPWSRWITPEAMKYRYDTLFFIAVMPPGQSCVPDGRETEHGLWISPEEALSANLDGTIPLTPPTIATMYELLDFPDAKTLSREWKTRRFGEAKLPRMVQSKSGPVILEPWDIQYDAVCQDMIIKEFGSDALSVRGPFTRLYLHNGIWKPAKA
jgi:8-oxo-dGTP pyrophosphatase MutT (NUDIX family)